MVVARELTKLHEEVWRGTLAEAAAAFAARDGARRGRRGPGRRPRRRAGPDDADVVDALRARLEAGDTLRDAAGAVARELGVSRRRAYDLALALRRNVEAVTGGCNLGSAGVSVDRRAEIRRSRQFEEEPRRW